MNDCGVAADAVNITWVVMAFVVFLVGQWAGYHRGYGEAKQHRPLRWRHTLLHGFKCDKQHSA